MTRLTTLEDIGILPKSIKYKGEIFMFSTWITFRNKLCIGYKHIFTHKSLISVIVIDNISYGTYGTYSDVIKINNKVKDIKVVIAETGTIENAFNVLYEIITTGNYKFK